VTPVIVGVGQVANKDPERIVHPVELMAEATLVAVEDAAADVLAHVGAVHAAPMSVFADDDASAMLAEHLGLAPGERAQWSYSGAAPQLHLGALCARIAAGELDAALVVGAIADASVRNAHRAGIESPAPPTSMWSVGVDRAKGMVPTAKWQAPLTAERSAGANMPTAIFGLVESAIAASRGNDIDTHRQRLGEVLAPFSEVAARRPDLAWNPKPRSAAEIATPSIANRMVAEPYTKLMCSFPTVDLGAAILVTSSALADRLGIADDRRVHPWTVADASEAGPPSVRADIGRSLALDAVAAHAVGVADRAGATIGAFDLYSCFPAAVEMAIDAFGLDGDPRPRTITGGLPFFGGPGASYVLHAIAHAVERSRLQRGDLTTVVGLGGTVQDFSVGLFGSEPGPAFDAWSAPDVAPAVAVTATATGPAVIEAATVLHDRHDGPTAVPIIARLPDGTRVGARAGDPALPAELSGQTLVGTTVELDHDGAKVWYVPS
jgi:acetyl-CoA C-acetyltransferase